LSLFKVFERGQNGKIKKMELLITALIVLLGSSVVAAVVSIVVNKWSEKESRIFNAKLDAYRDFSEHLQSRFMTLIDDKDRLGLTNLHKVASSSLLVANTEVSNELKKYLSFISNLFQKCCSEDYDAEKELKSFEKAWEWGDKIVDLMRKDLDIKNK